MTTLALAAVSLCVVVTLFTIVRRATNRVPANVGLHSMTVSRHWLTQHQSDDRP